MIEPERAVADRRGAAVRVGGGEPQPSAVHGEVEQSRATEHRVLEHAVVRRTSRDRERCIPSGRTIACHCRRRAFREPDDGLVEAGKVEHRGPACPEQDLRGRCDALRCPDSECARAVIEILVRAATSERDGSGADVDPAARGGHHGTGDEQFASPCGAKDAAGRIVGEDRDRAAGEHTAAKTLVLDQATADDARGGVDHDGIGERGAGDER